ncbi:MAG: hypothetical protein Q9219_005808 [cf. Caloplaca sp. 3 TL-2023]
MAPKRVLRSASKVRHGGNPKGNHAVIVNGSPSGTMKLDEFRNHSQMGLQSTYSAKKRKLERKETDSKNLASENVSLDRPAGLHSTNALLKTSQGHRLATCSQEMVRCSAPTTSTGRLLEQACAHLTQADPRLQPLIEKHHCYLFSSEGLAEEVDPFQSLCSGIMAQQVSGAAAKSIKGKFIDLFRDTPENVMGRVSPVLSSQKTQSFFPTPVQVAPCEVSFLRKAGLSVRKAEYIKGLAQDFVDGKLTTAMLLKANDKEIIEKLTAVRGLGLWSVQMFACFALKRTDIFSTGMGKIMASRKRYQANRSFSPGDLGVQRGMAAFMGKDVQKLKTNRGGKWRYMSESDMLRESAKFAPYR